jgi:hypothetical protein
MIWRILISLFAAWFLSLFGFGAFIIAGLAEFGIVITMTGYYLIFAVVGLLAWIFNHGRSSITIKKDD